MSFAPCCTSSGAATSAASAKRKRASDSAEEQPAVEAETSEEAEAESGENVCVLLELLHGGELSSFIHGDFEMSSAKNTYYPKVFLT